MQKTYSALEHGGSIRKGRRKIARPFFSDRPMHVTMRSSRAVGKWSFLHQNHRGIVYLLVLDTAERYNIQLHDWENVGNHLHLVIQASSKRSLQSFLRVLPQRVAFAVTGASKINPIGRFWDAIAHTRVVNWGHEFKVLKDYIWKNRLEALGFSKEEVLEMRKNSKAVPIFGAVVFLED